MSVSTSFPVPHVAVVGLRGAADADTCEHVGFSVLRAHRTDQVVVDVSEVQGVEVEALTAPLLDCLTIHGPGASLVAEGSLVRRSLRRRLPDGVAIFATVAEALRAATAPPAATVLTA